MLFEASAFRVLPERTIAFASGANRVSEICGFARLGIPVGVSVCQLSGRTIDLLCALKRPVLVDSGAFSEVVIKAGEVRVVTAISDEEWRRRLTLYFRLGAALARRAFLIAPDQVGSQQETLRRLKICRADLASIATTGARLLIPLQVGPMAHAEFYTAAEAAAGLRLEPAMPMRKAATSARDLADFVERVKPRHIHLLGLGLENRRTAGIIRVIRHYSPETSISMDSNRLRSVVGRARPLTVKEAELRSAETEDLYGAVESPVLKLTQDVLDYTDVICLPSLWASAAELRAIAFAACLSESQTALFLDDPDRFLGSPISAGCDAAWIEHPVMDWPLDQAWQQYVKRAIRSSVRTAAVISVFGSAVIQGQDLNAAF